MQHALTSDTVMPAWSVQLGLHAAAFALCKCQLQCVITTSDLTVKLNLMKTHANKRHSIAGGLHAAFHMPHLQIRVPKSANKICLVSCEDERLLAQRCYPCQGLQHLAQALHGGCRGWACGAA